MTVNELKEQLILLPDQLRQALAREAEARFNADRLAESVEKLREKLKNQEAGNDDDEESDDDSEDDDIELINIESNRDRLKAKLAAAEDKAEIAFRRENQKATNEHVKAAVGNDEDVARLRLELIDANEECKIKKLTLQRARREAMNARVEARRAAARGRNRPEPESEELDKLEEEHIEALRKAMEAEIEVEALRAKLDTFKILVQLESIS